jgi:hypothetical protein
MAGLTRVIHGSRQFPAGVREAKRVTRRNILFLYIGRAGLFPAFFFTRIIPMKTDCHEFAEENDWVSLILSI